MKTARNVKVNFKEICKENFKKVFKVHGVDSENSI